MYSKYGSALLKEGGRQKYSFNTFEKCIYISATTLRVTAQIRDEVLLKWVTDNFHSGNCFTLIRRKSTVRDYTLMRNSKAQKQKSM